NRAALLTPVAKAFATDIGCEVASLGVQVHGGMGYVEETGAAQLLRDARIAPIYEGTNGIQAIDLVTRKLPLDGGDHVRGYLGELREMVEEVRGSNRADLDGVADALNEGLDDLSSSTEWLLDRMAAGEKSAALSGATPYLRLFALAAGATYLGASAVRSEDADIEQRAAIARFAALDLLTATGSLRRSIEGGSAALLAAGDFLKSA
ncbi:MAG: acyl-CoA dehydrogenase, partial [Pseudomonadota bacterium]